jgi:rubrerythrin
MSKSEKNLREAFAGESQAKCLYLAFARQADQEGHHQVAKLFRAAAAAESVHALSHLRALGAILATVDNLQRAIAGETREYQETYPDMIAAARAEGHQEAERSFTYAHEAEKVHAGLYEKALANLGSQEHVEYFVCCVCGYTCENEPPQQCPVCRGPAQAFSQAG